MPQLKLYYFGVRGRAELIRYLLVYSNTPYEDVRIKQEDWSTIKPTMPFGHVPVLEIDGFKLSESVAIARHVAREYGLAGKNTWDQARADMLVDGLQDVRNSKEGKAVTGALIKNDPDELKTAYEAFRDGTLKTFLDRYNNFLAENGGKFFVGEDFTWADIAVAEYLNYIEEAIDQMVLDRYPALSDLVRRVHQHPNVQFHVSQREKTKL